MTFCSGLQEPTRLVAASVDLVPKAIDVLNAATEMFNSLDSMQQQSAAANEQQSGAEAGEAAAAFRQLVVFQPVEVSMCFKSAYHHLCISCVNVVVSWDVHQQQGTVGRPAPGRLFQTTYNERGPAAARYSVGEAAIRNLNTVLCLGTGVWCAGSFPCNT